ncbi:MAG: hypothetical protein NTX25_06480 [Proteobacteria bacterium]|nr:hypothetical protein [Pseudomonadota bacterium]
MPTVYVKTLGCKVNTYDTHAIENQFKALGYDLVDSPDAATVSVLNTCSVTETADKEARYLKNSRWLQWLLQLLPHSLCPWRFP